METPLLSCTKLGDRPTFKLPTPTTDENNRLRDSNIMLILQQLYCVTQTPWKLLEGLPLLLQNSFS